MTDRRQARSELLSLIFASAGHTIMHLMAAFYFVIVLALEKEWNLPYSDLIELWSVGALMIGLGAIPAGWLADRWSAPGMIVVMFLGLGVTSFYCATAATPASLAVGLAGIGLFASIYHPVAIAWIVRNASRRGRALGINGMFGSAGIAGSGLLTGLLIDLWGWRSAFLVPATVSMLFGLALMWFLLRGEIIDAETDRVPSPVTSRGDMLRAFALLLLAMFCMGIVFNAVQAGLPKVFDLRIGDQIGGGTLGIGALIAGVYTVSAVMQLVGGWLADRFPLKKVYIIGLLLQIPVLAWVAVVSGLPIVLAATLFVFLNASVLPAENVLVARFSPQNRRGLAYGLKFVVALGSAPLAVLLVSRFVERTGEFVGVFLTLSGLACLAVLLGVFLPIQWSERAAKA